MGFIRQVLSSKSGIPSSKRVMGVLAWLVVLVGYIYCIYRNQEAPEVTDIIIIGASSMLGIDSVASAFKKEG